MASQFRLSTTVGSRESSAGEVVTEEVEERWEDEERLTLLSSDLPLGRLVGKGLCGIVHETALRARKYARKDFVDAPRKTFKGEVLRLSRLGHKNVVNMYGYSFGSRSCSLLLELMDDDLLSFMQKEKESKRRKPLPGNPSSDAASRRISREEFTTRSRTFSDPSAPCPPPLDLPVALDIMLQIATGMKYLHDNGIAHGGLKPRNILVRYLNQGVLVKVSDFGLIQSKNASMSLVSHRTRMFDMAQWKAPEYLRKCKLDAESDEEDEVMASDIDYDGGLLRKADVYSFGMTSFQILTGEPPFYSRPWKDLAKCKTHPEGLRPTFPQTFEPRLVRLLESCWADSTQDRPTFLAIRKELKKIMNPPAFYPFPQQPSEITSQDEVSASSVGEISPNPGPWEIETDSFFNERANTSPHNIYSEVKGRNVSLSLESPIADEIMSSPMKNKDADVENYSVPAFAVDVPSKRKIIRRRLIIVFCSGHERHPSPPEGKASPIVRDLSDTHGDGSRRQHIQPGDDGDSEFDFAIPEEATTAYYKLYKRRRSSLDVGNYSVPAFAVDVPSKRKRIRRRLIIVFCSGHERHPSPPEGKASPIVRDPSDTHGDGSRRQHIQPGDDSDSDFDFAIPEEATTAYYKLYKRR